MNKSEARTEQRVRMSRRAAVNLDGAWTPCLIQNISTKGFLIMCTKPLTVGQVLEFKSELYPAKELRCKVEVRHINEEYMGTKVVEISEAGTTLCRQFLEEHYSEHLGRFG